MTSVGVSRTSHDLVPGLPATVSCRRSLNVPIENFGIFAPPLKSMKRYETRMVITSQVRL